MVIHHSGYNKKIIEITCEEFQLTILGNPNDYKSTKLELNKNMLSELLVSGDYEDKVIIKAINNYSELEECYNFMKPSFYENGEYQIVLSSKNINEFNIFHMDSNLSNEMQQFNDLKLGIIKFNSDIGYSSIRIIKNNRVILNLVIEVFPSKLDYKTDYKNIINDINEEISSLAFEILGKTYLNTVVKDTNKQTNLEYINILKFIFDDLEKDILRIVKRFKHNIENVESLKNIENSRYISRKTVNYIRKNPNTLVKNSKGFLNLGNKNFAPTKVIDKRKIPTIDIFENKYVKYMIQTIIKRLNIIEKNISRIYKAENGYLNFINEKKKILQKYLKVYFSNISDLRGKKSMTLVFQMSPGYREFYKKYVLLKKGLTLGEDLYKITPKKLYKLYEIWCYIKIHHIILELGYDVKEHGILKYKDNGVYLSLLQEKQARTIYKKGSEEIELWYNKSYSKLPTTNQRPDTVLCIKNLENKKERIYIFDAKYRVDVNNGVFGPMEEDINIMHRYRDSIVSKLSNGYQFQYETFGAYVMFPYADEKNFQRHKFYKSIDEVNIGAIPMLPGSTNLMKIHLNKIINESLLEAKDDRVIVDDLDENIRFKDKNVMVVNVKDKKHFEKYISEKFYHIPKSELGELKLGIKYLAFYQSKNSFKEEGGISYYGEIKKVYEYKRKECSEIDCKKGKENNIYLRFELVNLIKIKKIKPIQSARLLWYTTFYLLNNAENAHELSIKNSLEMKIYRKLNERAKKFNLKIKKQNGEYFIEDYKISILSNGDIYLNGNRIEFQFLNRIL